MMNATAKNRSTWLFSLRVKLLAVLIPLLVISMSLAMVGLGKFLHNFFRQRAELETEQLGQTVKAALRQAMLRKSVLSFGEVLAVLRREFGRRR